MSALGRSAHSDTDQAMAFIQTKRYAALIHSCMIMHSSFSVACYDSGHVSCASVVSLTRRISTCEPTHGFPIPIHACKSPRTLRFSTCLAYSHVLHTMYTSLEHLFPDLFQMLHVVLGPTQPS